MAGEKERGVVKVAHVGSGGCFGCVAAFGFCLVALIVVSMGGDRMSHLSGSAIDQAAKDQQAAQVAQAKREERRAAINAFSSEQASSNDALAQIGGSALRRNFISECQKLTRGRDAADVLELRELAGVVAGETTSSVIQKLGAPNSYGNVQVLGALAAAYDEDARYMRFNDATCVLVFDATERLQYILPGYQIGALEKAAQAGAQKTSGGNWGGTQGAVVDASGNVIPRGPSGRLSESKHTPSASAVSLGGGGGGTYVRGYTRKDGTYVSGHYRR